MAAFIVTVLVAGLCMSLLFFPTHGENVLSTTLCNAYFRNLFFFQEYHAHSAAIVIVTKQPGAMKRSFPSCPVTRQNF